MVETPQVQAAQATRWRQLLRLSSVSAVGPKQVLSFSDSGRRKRRARSSFADVRVELSL
jgi:hypothetical protein